MATPLLCTNDSKNDKNTANKLQCGLREVFYLFCSRSCIDILYLLRDNDLLAGLVLFLKIFGGHAELFQEQLAEIRRHEVEDWLHGLASSGLAPATCNRILAVFKTICSLAGMRVFLPAGQSPCMGVLPFKIHTQRERYLTQDEAQRLMRALEKATVRKLLPSDCFC